MRRARQQAAKTEADLAFDRAVEEEISRLKGVADVSTLCIREGLSRELRQAGVPSAGGSQHIHELAWPAAINFPRERFLAIATAIVSKRLEKALSK